MGRDDTNAENKIFFILLPDPRNCKNIDLLYMSRVFTVKESSYMCVTLHDYSSYRNTRKMVPITG